MNSASPSWPPFSDAVERAFSLRGKRVVVLYGNRNDLFWNPRKGEFMSLIDLLNVRLTGRWQREGDKTEDEVRFNTILFDPARGLSFPSDDDRKGVAETLKKAGKDFEAVAKQVQTLPDPQNNHAPLPNLVLARHICEGVEAARVKESKLPALAVLIAHGATMLPSGELEKLPELDRLRVAEALSWFESDFYQGHNLVVIVVDQLSQLNRSVLNLPTVEPIEVGLPTESERLHFLRHTGRKPAYANVTFDPTIETIAQDGAGLQLKKLESVLMQAAGEQQPVNRKGLLVEANNHLAVALNGIAILKMPTHTPDDLVGFTAVKESMQFAFDRCDDPATAVPVVIVPGPNGGGKTFTVEAFAAKSGRTVIELTGLRSQWYGGTDALFELLRFQLLNFGRVLITVDEAHTAFGSVHSRDSHETEKRLSGRIIQMMSDKRFRGRLLWVLMTSRPDLLDPDIVSRASVQIPILDLQGAEREEFVVQLLTRAGITVPDEFKATLLKTTETWSSRDLSELIAEAKAHKDAPLHKVLELWRPPAAEALPERRRFQGLIAAKHCSYPAVLPPWITELTVEQREREIDMLRHKLGL
jgi:hypothetical protein